MPRCNEQNMRLWIEALRSGNYRQAYGALREGSRFRRRFCVEGVARAIAIKQGAAPADNWRGNTMGAAAAKWLGIPVLDTIRAEVDGKMKFTFALHLNDERRWSFAEIADTLEAHYLPVDVLNVEIPDDASALLDDEMVVVS